MPIAVDRVPSSGRSAPRLARVAHGAGWLLLAAAAAALAYELAVALARGAYEPLAAGALWYQLDVSSLNLIQAITQRYLHPVLWDPVIAGILHWPAWSLLGAPGAALVIACPWRRQAC